MQLKLGSTADPAVPGGDSPLGTRADGTPQTVASLPSLLAGESPASTRQWPVPPRFQLHRSGLSSRTRRVVNRMADVLRMAATTLKHSQSALGAFYRRMVAKLGPAEGITAVAHKLARLLYSLI